MEGYHEDERERNSARVASQEHKANSSGAREKGPTTWIKKPDGGMSVVGENFRSNSTPAGSNVNAALNKQQSARTTPYLQRPQQKVNPATNSARTTNSQMQALQRLKESALTKGTKLFSGAPGADAGPYHSQQVPRKVVNYATMSQDEST